MKAIRLVHQGQPLEAHDVPIPNRARTMFNPGQGGRHLSLDAHYRAGKSRVHPLPLTLGHEVAGVVEQIGRDATGFQPATVSVFTIWQPGTCEWCVGGDEQFLRHFADDRQISRWRLGGIHRHADPQRLRCRMNPIEHGAISDVFFRHRCTHCARRAATREKGRGCSAWADSGTRPSNLPASNRVPESFLPWTSAAAT